MVQPRSQLNPPRMKFTTTRPAALLALCLGLGGWTVQAQPDKSLGDWAMDARSVADVEFICNGTDTATCADDTLCDCYCDVEQDVTCNGGANCPDLMACLTDCLCNVS